MGKGSINGAGRGHTPNRIDGNHLGAGLGRVATPMMTTGLCPDYGIDRTAVPPTAAPA